MAEIITMPRLSDTMTEGVVAKWLKHVGDKIEEGDILAEIELTKPLWNLNHFMRAHYCILVSMKEKLQV